MDSLHSRCFNLDDLDTPRLFEEIVKLAHDPSRFAFMHEKTKTYLRDSKWLNDAGNDLKPEIASIIMCKFPCEDGFNFLKLTNVNPEHNPERTTLRRTPANPATSRAFNAPAATAADQAKAEVTHLRKLYSNLENPGTKTWFSNPKTYAESLVAALQAHRAAHGSKFSEILGVADTDDETLTQRIRENGARVYESNYASVPSRIPAP
jgi:hypothetical protein